MLERVVQHRLNLDFDSSDQNRTSQSVYGVLGDLCHQMALHMMSRPYSAKNLTQATLLDEPQTYISSTHLPINESAVRDIRERRDGIIKSLRCNKLQEAAYLVGRVQPVMQTIIPDHLAPIDNTLSMLSLRTVAQVYLLLTSMIVEMYQRDELFKRVFFRELLVPYREPFEKSNGTLHDRGHVDMLEVIRIRDHTPTIDELEKLQQIVWQKKTKGKNFETLGEATAAVTQLFGTSDIGFAIGEVKMRYSRNKLPGSAARRWLSSAHQKQLEQYLREAPWNDGYYHGIYSYRRSFPNRFKRGELICWEIPRSLKGRFGTRIILPGNI